VAGSLALGGVAEAAPVLAGRVAPSAFILSESLTADVLVAEARAGASAVTAEAEANVASAGATTATTTGTTTAASGARTVVSGFKAAGGTKFITAAVAGTGGAAAVSKVPLGIQAEGPNLRRYHPNARSLPRGFRAYDAYEGGTSREVFSREKVGTPRHWALIANQTITNARWISQKQVLREEHITPHNVASHVSRALEDMYQDATDQMQKTPSRDPHEIAPATEIAPEVYLRIWKERPNEVLLHITFDGPVTKEIEKAALESVQNNAGALQELPPFSLQLNERVYAIPKSGIYTGPRLD
jgi:hypothetical protein